MSGYVVKLSCLRKGKSLWVKEVWVPSGDLEELFKTMKEKSQIFDYVIDVKSKHMGRPYNLFHWKATAPANTFERGGIYAR